MIRWSKFDTFTLFVGLAVIYLTMLAAVCGLLYLLALGVKSLFT